MLERLAFAGWPHCLRLANREIDLVLTTDVGPRILRAGFLGAPNLLHVRAEDEGRTGGDEWRLYGGHRLWHAPEAMPRSYAPDNAAVAHRWDAETCTLTLTQAVEATTGLAKEMAVTLDPDRNAVRVLHRLTNHNLWPVETSPWAITAFAAGGRAILPQEPWLDPSLDLLPSRPIALWHYTRMDDPRWVWGGRFIQLRFRANLVSEQKAGILNRQGWAAHLGHGALFLKRFGLRPEARYPDFGCNNEVYVNGSFLELETLGPLATLAPGGSVEHAEEWTLHRADGWDEDADEETLATRLAPLTRV